MNWGETLLWFGVGMPISVLALVVLDRVSTPSARRAFTPAATVRTRRHGLVRPAARAPGEAAHVPVDNGATIDASVTARDATASAAPAAPTSAPVPARNRRLVAVLEASTQPPRPVQHPWAPGDSVHQPLATGAPPAPATVRKRVWSAYATIAPATVYGPENVERLERGRPPQRYNPLAGGVELMQVNVDDVGHARIAWADSGTACDPFAVAS